MIYGLMVYLLRIYTPINSASIIFFLLRQLMLLLVRGIDLQLQLKTNSQCIMQGRLYSLSNYHALWHSAVLYCVTSMRRCAPPESEKRRNPSGKSRPPPHDACPSNRHACSPLPHVSLASSYKRDLSCPCVSTVFFLGAGFFSEKLLPPVTPPPSPKLQGG